MLKLKQFRDKAEGLPDLLNYASLIDKNIILNKDGSLIAGFSYRGHDLQSLSDEEKNDLSARINSLFREFGSGWMFNTDVCRLPCDKYDFDKSYFPDKTSQMMENERKDFFTNQNNKFDSTYFFTISYLPPFKGFNKLLNIMVDDGTSKHDFEFGEKIVSGFKHKVESFISSLSLYLRIEPLGTYEIETDTGIFRGNSLLEFLNFTITTDNHPIKLPSCPMYLDLLLGGQELRSGLTPKIGEKNIGVVSIDSFPDDSYPTMIAALDSMPFPYRWSTRFIFMDQDEGRNAFKKYQRYWDQKKRGLISQVMETPSRINHDAERNANEIDSALNDLDSGVVKYGYYTACIVLCDEDREHLEDKQKYVENLVKTRGFGCRAETINCLEAWYGSLPGHSFPNVRRPPVSTLNLADLIPLTGVCAGHTFNPCDKIGRAHV